MIDTVVAVRYFTQINDGLGGSTGEVLSRRDGGRKGAGLKGILILILKNTETRKTNTPAMRQYSLAGSLNPAKVS